MRNRSTQRLSLALKLLVAGALTTGPVHVALASEGAANETTDRNLAATSPLETRNPEEGAEAPSPEPVRVTVRATTAAPLVLYVDGAPVGPLPWTGTLATGDHELRAEGSEWRARARALHVEASAPEDVSLDAERRIGRVRLEAADPQATILVDGRVVGRGRYEASLPVGDHAFAFLREGYERVDMRQSVEEDKTVVEHVSLLPIAMPKRQSDGAPPNADAAPKKVGEDSHGVTASILFAGALQVGAAGSEAERACDPNAQCGGSPAAGSGAFLSFGYMWRYAGFDVVAGGSLDGAARKAGAPTSTDAFTAERLSGMAAVRLRGAIQTNIVRLSAGVGPGVVYRMVGAAGSFPSLPDDTASYRSFAVSGDLNAQLRWSDSSSLVVGAMLWVDNAGSDVQIARNGAPYHLVSGAQTSFMPYVGFQFGP